MVLDMFSNWNANAYRADDPDEPIVEDRHAGARVGRPHLAPMTVGRSELHWVGLRSEPPDPDPRFFLGVPLTGAPEGAFVIATGLDQGGAAWLDRLTRSAWFDGLSLGESDLRASALASPAGTVSIAGPDTPLPLRAPLITLAIDDPGAVDVAMAATVVRTLMRCGRVMATMPAGDSGRRLKSALRTAGAFVVTAAPDVPLDHLHHFPLRPAIMRPHHRLACVDLADVLIACGPGEAGTLSNCPGLAAAAASKAEHADAALLALWLADPPEWDLRKLVRRLLRAPEPQIVTTADHLHGNDGSVDLLMPDAS